MHQILFFVAILFCFQVLWIKCSLPYDAYMAEESVLDRLNRGQSLLDRENFQITLMTVVFTNVYFLVTFYICSLSEDQQLGWMVHIELFCLLVIARHYPWMQFSIQYLLF